MKHPERCETVVPNPFPFFKFNPVDWLTSVSIRMMTIEQEGAYHRLLCEEWLQHDCGLPDDDEKLAILSGLLDRWASGSHIIRQQFISRNGRLYNERLLHEWKEVASNSQKARRNANMRWQSGRNAVALPTHSDSNAVAMPSVSVSVSSSVVTSEEKQTAEVRPDLDVWASGVYARWKKYRDRPLAEQALCSPIFNREKFEATYDKWLDYHERAGWQYAPTLAAFLYDRTYEHEPPAINEPPRRKSIADQAFDEAVKKMEKEEGWNE
jgi:uncharacterized protein YdaU (DUF1376 family)